MVPFWVPIIIRHPLLRVPKKGTRAFRMEASVFKSPDPKPHRSLEGRLNPDAKPRTPSPKRLNRNLENKTFSRGVS